MQFFLGMIAAARVAMFLSGDTPPPPPEYVNIVAISRVPLSNVNVSILSGDDADMLAQEIITKADAYSNFYDRIHNFSAYKCSLIGLPCKLLRVRGDLSISKCFDFKMITVSEVDGDLTLNNLPSLESFSSLPCVGGKCHITDCNKLTYVPCIQVAGDFKIRNCTNLRDIGAPVKKDLYVSNCPNLEKIRGTIQQNLYVRNCPKLNTALCKVNGRIYPLGEN